MVRWDGVEREAEGRAVQLIEGGACQANWTVESAMLLLVT